MKAQRNQPDRHLHFSLRRPPGSSLLHKSNLYFNLLLLLVPVCLTPSCRHTEVDPLPSDEVWLQTDTSRFTVFFKVTDNTADTTRTVRRLNIFVYDADGLRELLLERRYDFLPDSAVFYCKARNVSVVAVADSPREFNSSALERYDSIELLTYSFSDDSPTQPVMSGQQDVESGGRGTLVLTPLLARIITGEVSNKLKGYVRLEDPRIYLENMNASAELLRTAGFLPSETLQSPPVKRLPFDIGVFSQTPGTELFCYPNDSEEATIGNPATVFVLECEIQGATRRFSVPLPGIRRNSTTRVDITVTGETTCESKVY